MSCGCHAKAEPSIANRAAMCQTCPMARRDGIAAVECRVLGRPIVAAAYGTGCPIGRWPDKHGVVRWAGLDWLGVPEPIRWRLVWTLGREPRGLDGCGCIAAVKRSWLGPIIEPWAEGISTLRRRFAEALSEWQGRQSWNEHHA